MIYQVRIQSNQSPAEPRRRSVSTHVDNDLLISSWGFRTETHPDSVILFVALCLTSMGAKKSHDAHRPSPLHELRRTEGLLP